jgi:hypothetical protein
MLLQNIAPLAISNKLSIPPLITPILNSIMSTVSVLYDHMRALLEIVLLDLLEKNTPMLI